jgi:hypothetical protein
LWRVGTGVAVVVALVGVAGGRSLGLEVDAGARGGGVLLVCATLTLVLDDLVGAGARAGGVEDVVGCTVAAATRSGTTADADGAPAVELAKSACVGDGGGDVLSPELRVALAADRTGGEVASGAAPTSGRSMSAVSDERRR